MCVQPLQWARAKQAFLRPLARSWQRRQTSAHRHPFPANPQPPLPPPHPPTHTIACLLQVDFLFSKMAAKRERTELDTTKLLELLVRLARSDPQVRSAPLRPAPGQWAAPAQNVGHGRRSR